MRSTDLTQSDRLVGALGDQDLGTIAPRAHLRRLLCERRESLVADWYDLIAGSSVVSVDGRALRGQLEALTDEIISLLVSGELSCPRSQAIGQTLAGLGYIPADALGRALGVLGHRLLEGMDAHTLAALQPRVAVLLGELVAGFLRQQREAILTEQASIHEALLAARDQAEHALHESEERFRRTFDEAPMGIMLTDMAGTILESNGVLQEMLGYSADELHGMNVAHITHEDDVATDRDLAEELVSGKRDRYQREKRYVCKGGEVVWGHLSVSLLRSAQGKPQIAIRMIKDITARKRAEEAVRASEARYRAVVTQSAEGIILVDPVGARIRESNPAFQRLLGYTEEELVGLSLYEIVADDRSTIARNIRQAISQGHYSVREHGRPRNVVVRLRPRRRGVILRVSDDGSGFVVPAQLSTLARTDHYGLVGMAERLAEVKGRLRVRSRPGLGTIVTAWAPLAIDREGKYDDDQGACSR